MTVLEILDPPAEILSTYSPEESSPRFGSKFITLYPTVLWKSESEATSFPLQLNNRADTGTVLLSA
jgi:hypothetical protein